MNQNKSIHAYDVVIIGSGLGGLVSGLLLAKSGKKVCILEKNNQFGGNLQTFARDKKIFDTGVHYVGGLAEGQNLHRYFSYLDILDDVEWEQLDQEHFDRIYIHDEHKYYAHAQGYAAFEKQLLIDFPQEKIAIQKYIELVQDYCKAFPMYQVDFSSSYQTEYLEKSVQDVMEAVTTNATLQAVLLGNNFLYGLDYANTPFYVHALTVNSYIESAWRCVKGGSQLTKALLKQLKKLDAVVLKHQEVTDFLTQEQNIVACETNDSVFKADLFVSNINLKTTIQFLPEQLQKKPSFKRIQSLKVGPSVFSVHLVLKDNYIPYFNHNIYHLDTIKASKDYVNPIDENFPKQMVITTNPLHKNQIFADTITLMTYMDYDCFSKWDQTQNTVANKSNRGADYEIFKKILADKMIAKLALHFPNIHEAVTTYYTSSPLSYRDYIGVERGNMYGFEKFAQQPHLTQIAPKTKINNLFFTGQNVRMHGILGVTISAFHLVKEVIGVAEFKQLLEK